MNSDKVTFLTSVRFNGSTSGYVTVQAPAIAGTSLLVLPDASGTLATISDISTTTHSHDLSDLTQSSATSGQVPQWNGSTWVAANAGGGGDALVANPLSQFASTTSAQLAVVISDETGSGGLVFRDTPTLITPILGVATATSVNKITFTSPATGATITITDGKTLTANNTIILSGTDGSGLNIGDGGTLGTAAYTSSSAYQPSGTIAVTSGGTGLTTLTANNVILGNGTSNPTFVAPSSNGNVLTSNGTTWTSAAAGGGGLTLGKAYALMTNLYLS